MRIDPCKSLLDMGRVVVGCGIVLLIVAAALGQPDGDVSSSAPAAVETESAADDTDPAYATESLRGRVVWLAEALKRRFGIVSDTDAQHTVAALETPDGQIFPLVKDDRGRGFWLDPRLHGIDMELRVRRFRGSPVVQVIRVYTLEDDKKYELDYWCDICAIPMYELKPCECCQGPIRFRRRLVDEVSETPQSTQQGGGDASEAAR